MLFRYLLISIDSQLFNRPLPPPYVTFANGYPTSSGSIIDYSVKMKYGSTSSQWPTPQCSWLSDIVTCFRTRPRSMPKCQVVMSFDKGHERLDFDFVQFPCDQVRLTVWDDGVIWFCACRGSKKGWVYCHSFYAVRRTEDPMDLREALSESLVRVEVSGYAESVWHRVCQPYTEKNEETDQAAPEQPLPAVQLRWSPVTPTSTPRSTLAPSGRGACA